MRAIRGSALRGSALRGSLVLALACAIAIAPSGVDANTSTAFPSGSLIIPPSSAFQDDCGSVSAYGLIYDVLRANPWLSANGYQPVTIFFDYLDTKQSPNRCVPTTSDIPPSGSAMWSDGCDITGVQATLINNANHNVADGNIITFNNTTKTNVYPLYPSQTVSGTMRVNYMGGPFVILASDALTFEKLLDGTIQAKDTMGNLIDFTQFRTRSSTQTAPPNSTCKLATDHYVNIHRANAAFVANIGKAFQAIPPRLALLATDRYNYTGTVSNNILQGYLANAGLDYTGAAGCPPESVYAGTHSVCPNGATSGQIFDSFDFDDLVNNQLAASTMSGSGSATPLYTMLWTPHWEISTGGANTREKQAMSYIATFLDGQTGLAAECASVSSYEGTTLNGVSSSQEGLQLQTCKASGSACSASTATYGLDRNSDPPGIPDTTGAGIQLRNCSDPNVTTGTECAYYSYPGDSFVQTADYIWTAVYGHTLSYIPQSGSMYKPGVVPLISVVSSLDRTKLGTPVPYDNSGYLSTSATAARAMITADLSTRNVKDNTAGKANVLYLAGHDETSSVAGTKLMMTTLLQLGLTTLPTIAVTTEVSRNSPIDATINNTDAILQGTYLLASPPPTVPTYSVNGDSATFTFPAVEGHMRARASSSITTAATTYSAGTILFDAAGGIPAPTYAGCGTYFTANCRTVFTTMVAGEHPAMHMLQQSELPNLGPLMGSNLDLGDQGLLMQRVLAGDDSLVPGYYRPALGGVDHSTVAVIGTSDVVNGTRPQMAYFGATDGMLHAVCAGTGGPCDIAGRELWAYLPRTSLSTVRYNTARVDGSPHVIDAYGDFLGTGEKSWRTILMFQTGFGDTTSSDRLPAVYALDVSDPTNPSVIWEYSLANPAVRGTYELGQGLDLSAGHVQIGATTEWVVFAQTNNGGTGGSANVVTAINMETGAPIWQQGYQFTVGLRSGGTTIPSATGIPGGAVAVDKTGAGYVTDVVFGTLYGDLWDVNPTTGVSVDGAGKPLLRFSTDYHPIGAAPAIYTNGGIQYAVITTGGYVDTYPNDTTWTKTGNINYALAVSLNTPVADTTINESKGSPDIAFKLAFGAGEASYAQATVIGDQVFITTDTGNVNDTTSSSAYGLNGATGHVYNMNFQSGVQGSTVVVEGGASSVINSGNNVYSGASDTTQQLAQSATCYNCGTGVDTIAAMKVTRRLWLRVQ